MSRANLWAASVAFIAIVLSAATASATPWPDLSDPLPGTRAGKKDAALIVGVSDYIFAPDIEGAVENAEDWYAHLTRTRGVPIERVTLLRDNEATRERIARHLATAASEVEAGGTLWVVFIGHGAPGLSGREGVLVGVDAQVSADGLHPRSLGQAELTAIVSKGRQANTVALLDTCFSGQTPTGPLLANLQPLIPVTHTTDDVTILTAATTDQLAGPLPGASRPAFSYLVLGALRGWADADGDARVTAQEAVLYAKGALRLLVNDRVQTPTLDGPNQRAALSVGATERGPDLQQIVLDLRPKDTKITITPSDPSVDRVDIVVPSRPSRPVRGTYVRLGFGTHTLPASGIAAESGLERIEYEGSFGNDWTLESLDLDEANGDASMLGVNAELAWGVGSLGVSLGTSIRWGNDLGIRARIKSEDDISGDLQGLDRGVEARIDSIFSADFTLEPVYRFRLLDPVLLYLQGGIGGGFDAFSTRFDVGEVENDLNVVRGRVVLPVRAGVDVDLGEDLFLHGSYSFFVLPDQSSMAQGGVGFYY